MSFGIKGKFIVGFDGEEHRLLEDGVVVVEGRRIKHVGKTYSGEVERWIDASKGLVMPGLINTHIHASSSPKDKSFLEDVGARHFYMSSLGENLTALGMSMRNEDKETFARYSLAECLLSGNTTLVEIGMVGSLGAEGAVKVIDEVGIRALEGPGIRDGTWERTQGANIQTKWFEPEVGLKGLEEAEEFAKRYDGALDGRIIAAFYPDKVDTCSEGLQRSVKEKADELGLPVSIHAGQWVVEFQNMLRMYRKTPVEFLHHTGLLCPRLIIGHGWAISGHPLVAYPPVGGGDLQLLAESGATVSHDPVVFVKRGNKLHSHSRYLAAGVNVSIGTDSAPQDMLNEMRMASYVSKLADWDCHSGTSREVFYSATLGGAKGIGRSDLGRLAPGALADIAIVDMSGINAVPVRDPIRNLVNSCQRSDVKTVIVNGKIVVEDGRLLTADQGKIAEEVQRAAEGIYERIPENHYLNLKADEVSPQSLKPWRG
ncbi:MAG: amidohydrolase family protein [Candidatus Bathyarchaeota archaeon]|nr:MAG: amidohydrolase family protein [Candidatus Bathyarchaeota archaeon]